MLTALKIGNFKAFRAMQTIPIRPITLISEARAERLIAEELGRLGWSTAQAGSGQTAHRRARATRDDPHRGPDCAPATPGRDRECQHAAAGVEAVRSDTTHVTGKRYSLTLWCTMLDQTLRILAKKTRRLVQQMASTSMLKAVI